jgi:hypothetical protein
MKSAFGSENFWVDHITKCFIRQVPQVPLLLQQLLERLLKLNPEQMLHAFGSAGTQSAGLWEFLRDAADSKQLHTAHAASTGLMSAYIAKYGFTGAQHILEGKQGLAAGMSSDAAPGKLVDRLGTRWALTETSFQISCILPTHPPRCPMLYYTSNPRSQTQAKRYRKSRNSGSSGCD